MTVIADRDSKFLEAKRLRDVEGLGDDAIARRLGVHMTTVRNWLVRDRTSWSSNARHAPRRLRDPSQVYTLDEDNPAIVQRRTMFPTRVFAAADVPRILISGVNSPKTGRMVLKGDWTGMPIYTLTLEERATCPPSCYMATSCYGNGMPFARRVSAGTKFELALIDEVADLAKDHPRGFVVRLHVLGDFYSAHYVTVWQKLLAYVPELRVFGYTGRSLKRDKAIAEAILAMNDEFPERCFIRFSARASQPGGTTVIARLPEAARVPEGIVCAAELHKSECCGTCGLCWAEAARGETIVFVKHGPGPPPRRKAKR